ncbi:hypothetical protein FOL46_009982 [Perkinsus olseni]|uniref:Retrotransposon gag domain-containing protein n=1 Tax=Perkinsus olseni TaxID=32597 RepID=A0A7J6KZG2_PEROL|nr:hypothetical protein FOL46_009982 [Perkinsus olseni]
MLLKNPLRRDSYSEAVDDIWRALERRAGKNRESEILQSEGLTMQQKKGESVSDFLHRVNDFRLRCQCAGISHKDSYWITLCRVGLTNELIKKLSCLSAVRTWEEWSENVEQMAGDDAAGGRVLEVLGVSASNAGGTLNSGTGNDATRGRGDGKGPAEFRGKQGG